MAISSLLGRLTVLFHTSEENLPKLPEKTETTELKVRTETHHFSVRTLTDTRAHTHTHTHTQGGQ